MNIIRAFRFSLCIRIVIRDSSAAERRSLGEEQILQNPEADDGKTKAVSIIGVDLSPMVSLLPLVTK